jgi:hypothetical protein
LQSIRQAEQEPGNGAVAVTVAGRNCSDRSGCASIQLNISRPTRYLLVVHIGLVP